MKRFPIHDLALLIKLFFSHGAGVEFAGESGSGKSRSLMAILRTLFLYLHFCVFIDPDNDTAEELHQICLADPQLAPRTDYFQLNDPALCGTFDPLQIIEDDNPLVTEARRVARVEFLVHIILSSWGEVDLDSRPVLAKNLFRILLACSRLNLPFSEASLFFDLHSPAYSYLCRGVLDPVDRQEMLELPGLRPMEREQQLGSAMNRIKGILRNPLMQAIFSKTKTSGAFDFLGAHRAGRIVIVNAHCGTTLRKTDQQLLANMFLSSAIDVVMTRPLHERKNSLIAVEEMPVFRSSEDLLFSTFSRIRKFNTRFAVCHQGAHTFEAGLESRLLASIRSNFQTHFFFRSSHPADAKHTAEQIHLPTLDLKKVKFEHWEKEQYQDGHELVVLTDRTESKSEGVETGSSEADGDTTTDTRSTSSADQKSLDSVRQTITSTSANASADATTHTSTTSSSKSSSNSSGFTHKQTLVPKHSWRRVLRMLQFWNAEEQYLQVASRLAGQRAGQAIVYCNGLGAQQFQFPLLKAPFHNTPRYAAKKLAEAKQKMLARPEFDSIENIQIYRQQFLELLLAQLAEQNVELPPNGMTAQKHIVEQPAAPPLPENTKNGPWTI